MNTLDNLKLTSSHTQQLLDQIVATHCPLTFKDAISQAKARANSDSMRLYIGSSNPQSLADALRTEKPSLYIPSEAESRGVYADFDEALTGLTEDGKHYASFLVYNPHTSKFVDYIDRQRKSIFQ